ncbi:MAG: AarF/ABC1/UbiB kinase family protein [Verrucomicrobiota bacterium]
MSRTLRYLRLFKMLLNDRVEVDLDTIQSWGLLAVKISQMYAVRTDLLPSEKCQSLSRLFENATPISTERFETLVRKLAPPSLLDHLLSIHSQPLATASLGQVHRAVLDSRAEVVVKILRDDHQAEFEKDLKAVRQLAQSALFFYPKLERVADPIGVLEAVERTTLNEIILTREISGTETLKKLRDQHIKDLPHLEQLHFPAFYPDFSNEHVLVSDFIPAPTVRKLLEGNRFPYEALLTLFRIQGYFLFYHGKFHGDLHPGNIHYDPHSKSFWLLDNANVESVPPEFARGLLYMLGALGDSDFQRAADTLMAISSTPPKSQSAFVSAFLKLYGDFSHRPVAEISLTRQMAKTIRLAVDHGLTFPKGAFPVVKSLMYLDGMALKCNPDARLLQDVLAFQSDIQKLLGTTDQKLSSTIP